MSHLSHREKRQSARHEFYYGSPSAAEQQELSTALLSVPSLSSDATSPTITETLSSELSPSSSSPSSNGDDRPFTPSGPSGKSSKKLQINFAITEDSPIAVEEGVLESEEAVALAHGAISSSHPPSKDEANHPTTSNMQTLANFIKGNIGTGILSLPHAMKNAGLLVGTVATLAVGFLCTYCMHQLLHAYYKVAQGRAMDYADVAEQVFAQSKYNKLNRCAKIARHVTNAFLILTQIGICCVYLVFCPKMIKEVVDSYFEDWRHISILFYQAGMTLLMIPYCFVTTLAVLSIFSMIANFLTIACLIAILQYVFRNLQPVDSLPMVTNANDFFMFFGSVMFAFESISLVLPLENRMKDRGAFGKWNGLMSLGMTFVIALYTGVGFYGYLAFGADSKLILRNLPDHWVYHVTKLVWTLCIFISYNLQMYVPVQIIWPSLKAKVNKPFFDKFGEYFLRTGLVLLTFGLAATIPCLEQMISLVGALAMSSLALCIPPILEIVSELPQKQIVRAQRSTASTMPLCQSEKSMSSVASGKARCNPVLGNGGNRSSSQEVNKCRFAMIAIRGTVIFLFGLAGAVVGTYVTIVEIIHLLQSEQGCSK